MHGDDGGDGDVGDAENLVGLVRLLRGTPRRVRRQLYGHRIRAVCGTNFVFSRGVKVRRTRLWPSGRRRVRFRRGRLPDV